MERAMLIAEATYVYSSELGGFMITGPFSYSRANTVKFATSSVIAADGNPDNDERKYGGKYGER